METKMPVQKQKIRVAGLLTLSLLLVLSYQNCAPGFTTEGLSSSALSSEAPPDSNDESGNGTPPTTGGGSTATPTPNPTPTPPANSGGGGTYVDPTYAGNAPGNLITAQKNVPTTAGTATMTWDLGTEVASGTAISGARISVQISKLSPADGSTPVYLISNPTLTTGSRALDVVDLRVGVDGTRNDVSTTFQGIDITVPAGTTRSLSTATLLHEIGNTAAQHKLSLHFRLLWPDGVALPTAPSPTAPPALTGAQLYAQHCLSCHGSLATSTKRGATAQRITTSFTTAPSMSYLATVLSAQDVNAIADALK